MATISPIALLWLFFVAPQIALAWSYSSRKSPYRTRQSKLINSGPIGLCTDVSNTRLSLSDEQRQSTSEETESKTTETDNTKAEIASTPNPAAGRPLSTNELLGAMGTTPRRIAVSLLSATGIALAGNLFGVTSNILTTLPEELVESTGLDSYFPRGSFKRQIGSLYTFVVPKEWVADTSLELAKAQQRMKSLDYNMNGAPSKAVLPDAAFGPPGNANLSNRNQRGDSNVSVLISDGLPTNFSLRSSLGTPTVAANTYLQSSLAPEGSGRTATLVSADEDTGRGGVYQFEYEIDRGSRGPPLRAISVIAASSGNLLTLTIVAPAKDWTGENDIKYRKVASSFHLRYD